MRWRPRACSSVRPELQIRPMRPADLPAAFALQCRVYPDVYHEPQEALASRLEAGPAFCWVAEQGGQLAGYVFAHPWSGAPPPLHEPLPACVAEHLFLHDLAVCPNHRGMAAGRQLYACVAGEALRAGLDRIRLVAVGSASAFWQRQGFAERVLAGLHPAYGQAQVMQQDLIG
ncbi:N-acetyltransferase [Uliginosibacterium sp. TH139]|nr:N-acetyltransferase [Uliginosibacterium sp. TH139]